MKLMKLPFPSISEIKNQLGNIQDCSSIYEIAKLLNGYRLAYPVLPTKPVLPTDHTYSDIVEYGNKVIFFDAKVKEFNKLKESVTEYNSDIDDLVEESIKEFTGFYDRIPVQYQHKVWENAWSTRFEDNVMEKLEEYFEIFG